QTVGDRGTKLPVHRPPRCWPALGHNLLDRRFVPAARQRSASLSARRAHPASRDDQSVRLGGADSRELEACIGSCFRSQSAPLRGLAWVHLDPSIGSDQDSGRRHSTGRLPSATLSSDMNSDRHRIGILWSPSVSNIIVQYPTIL